MAELDLYRFVRQYTDTREAAGAASRVASGNEALRYFQYLASSSISPTTKQQIMHEVIRLGGLTADPLNLISLALIASQLPKSASVQKAVSSMLVNPIKTQEENPMEDSITTSDEYDVIELFAGTATEHPSCDATRAQVSPTTRMMATRILGMTYIEMREFTEEMPGGLTELQWLDWAKQKV